MRKLIVMFGILAIAGAVTPARAQEVDVILKPAKRRPASVDPARPLNPKNTPEMKSLKADPGRKFKNLRISPRRQPPILDIDVSIKDESE